MSTIKIFTTGGSIDKYYATKESDFIVGPSVIGPLLQEANVTTPYVVESLLAKDSLAITAADRQMIRAKVAAEPNGKIIITHGTDTMLKTAQALTNLVDKVIILTGAMQPAAFKITDAVFNIGCAFAAVQVLPAGVYVVMNGMIFAPDKTRKNLAENRFEEI